MLKQNVCVLITGNPYFHPAIDLSLCHPSLYLDLSWSVLEDLFGSEQVTITHSFMTTTLCHRGNWTKLTGAPSPGHAQKN